MTPANLLVMAIADGVTMTLTDCGRIRLSGDQVDVDRWLATVNQYQAELINELSKKEMT